jgi:hypothetical protein
MSPTRHLPSDISFQHLRICIGVLGILVPASVFLIANIIGNCDCLQDSISHYYYTISGPVFVAVMFSLGLILIFYPTPPPDPNTGMAAPSAFKWLRILPGDHDAGFTTVSGICAIAVALVPTNAFSDGSCAMFVFNTYAIREWIHYGSAALMLVIFSYMSMCVFTRTNDENWRKNRWKAAKIYTYLFCGIATLVSIALIGYFEIREQCWDIPVPNKSTFYLEVTALVPFGVSWLVKGFD